MLLDAVSDVLVAAMWAAVTWIDASRVPDHERLNNVDCRRKEYEEKSDDTYRSTSAHYVSFTVLSCHNLDPVHRRRSAFIHRSKSPN